MVQIDGIKTYTTVRTRKKDRVPSKTAGSFSPGLPISSSSASDISTPQSAAEVASLQQLMALQEMTESDAHQKKILQEGETILQSLEQLQTQILSGRISKNALHHIASLVQGMPGIMDPRLKAIIAEIRQRAMIEIAKIEMSSGQDYSS